MELGQFFKVLCQHTCLETMFEKRKSARYATSAKLSFGLKEISAESFKMFQRAVLEKFNFQIYVVIYVVDCHRNKDIFTFSTFSP